MTIETAVDRDTEGQILRRIYARRFGTALTYRNQVWRTLNTSFFS